jgi:hypothetical protein
MSSELLAYMSTVLVVNTTVMFAMFAGCTLVTSRFPSGLVLLLASVFF